MARVYICSFCYKTCRDRQPKNNVSFTGNSSNFRNELDPNPALQRFLIILQTYLGESFSSSVAFESLKACSNCIQLMESFCTIFLEMKCFESQLELKLQQFQSVMTFADTARPTFQSISDLNSSGNEQVNVNANGVADISSFREELKTKCTTKLFTSFPNSAVVQQSPFLTPEWAFFGMGWIMSFIVVSILATNLQLNAPPFKVLPAKNEVLTLKIRYPVDKENDMDVQDIANPMEETNPSKFFGSYNSSTSSKASTSKRTLFPCKFCKKLLRDRYELKKHAIPCRNLYIREHPSEKIRRPLLKSVKDIEFDRQYIKSTVINFSHQYNCVICGFLSYHKSTLREHVKGKHPVEIQETPLKCYYCEITFSETTQLQEHLMYLHDNEKHVMTRDKKGIETRKAKAKGRCCVNGCNNL